MTTEERTGARESTEGRATAMGLVDDKDEDAGSEPSVDWWSALGIGMPIGCVVGVAVFLLIYWWIDPAHRPARLRATATHQTLAFPLPVVAQPPTFAETVQVHASAMRTAELAAAVETRKAALLAAEGRELDLLVIVEAPPGMSAKEVADQAAELANRLRCKIKVQFQGRKVQARPGMSRVSFVKQATGFSADDGICLAIVVTALAGCWFVFWRNP
jgi:hypothetical protein